MLKKTFLTFLILLLISTPLFAVEYSDTSRFMQGFGKVVAAPFKLPTEVLTNTFTQFPFGVVTGAVSGAYHTGTSLMSGVVDMAGAAAPYAKYALFF